MRLGVAALVLSASFSSLPALAEGPAVQATTTSSAATTSPKVEPAAKVEPSATTTAQPAAPELDHQALLQKFNARIAELEGKILLAKQKVDVLRDTVLGGAVTKSRGLLIHRNEMGTAFVLERATYTLDGAIVFDRDNTDGALDANKEFEIFNGPLTVGDHDVGVQLTYGASATGMFSQTPGFKVKVDSKYRFNAVDGRLTTMNIVSFAKGDVTTNTSDRIAVRYDLEVGNLPGTP